MSSYETVPRVMKCAGINNRKGVVFFHSSDNPYGNPREVMLNLLSRDTRFKRERFYGVADKLISGKFPLFNDDVHVIPHDRIPIHGTDYLIVDPCEGRSFFMLWIRAVATDRAYVIREWPSQVDPIPGYGILGEWALPTGDGKLMDGRRGPAQNSLGWGLTQYKQEIARLEQWEEYSPDASPDEIAKWEQYPEDVPAEARKAAAEAGTKRHKIFQRFLDARFGNTDSLDRSGVRTIFEEFDEIGLTFYETSSDVKRSVDAGVNMINSALYYNEDQPIITDFNEPKLYVSDRCKNLIFAMHNWTNLDGGKGATKDPIDCLRYFYLKHCQHVDDKGTGGVAGVGCY